MAAPSEAGLVRAIGARQLTASIINVTIGAGIFVLPAAAAAGLGPAAPDGLHRLRRADGADRLLLRRRRAAACR